MDGWLDGWIDGWMDGLMDGWIDGLMDGCMDGCMDGWMDVLQEEQSLCFLNTAQNIQLGQSRITFPSQFCVWKGWDGQLSPSSNLQDLR